MEEDEVTEGCWGRAAPLGMIVEARLNGAGAGKVSVEQGRRRRKYHSCMEGDDT